MSFSSDDYKNIKVIGFDLDQTLYPKSDAINHAIRSYIYQKIIEANSTFTSEKAQEEFDYLYDVQGLSVSQALNKLKVPNPRNVTQDALEQVDLSKCLHSDKNVNKLLEQLSVKYELDLITGSHYTNMIDKLKHIEIPQATFNHMISGEKYSKSDGRAFEHWLSLYPQLTADNFLYIGDRVSTDSAVPTGQYKIRSILVNTNKDDPDAMGPQLPSLFDIKDLLL